MAYTYTLPNYVERLRRTTETLNIDYWTSGREPNSRPPEQKTKLLTITPQISVTYIQRGGKILWLVACNRRMSTLNFLR